MRPRFHCAFPQWPQLCATHQCHELRRAPGVVSRPRHSTSEHNDLCSFMLWMMGIMFAMCRNRNRATDNMSALDALDYTAESHEDPFDSMCAPACGSRALRKSSALALCSSSQNPVMSSCCRLSQCHHARAASRPLVVHPCLIYHCNMNQTIGQHDKWRHPDAINVRERDARFVC